MSNGNPLRVAVIGAGAMGSFFGGLLAKGGADVTLVDVNRAHLDAIAGSGLRIDTDDGARTIRLRAVSPDKVADGIEGRFDLVLVFTKTMHTRAALSPLAHLIAPDTFLMSVQNGLGNKENLLDFAEASRVVIGMTTYPADMVAPGHVASHGFGKVRFMSGDGSPSPMLGRIANAFRAGGLDGASDPLVERQIWEKVAFNAALNTIAAVTRATVGGIGARAETRRLAHAIAAEVVEVAHATGIEADGGAVHALLDEAMDKHLTHKPSMLQDVLAGRQTEIDAIAGAVIRHAEKAGVAVPSVRAMHALVLLATEGREG
jgi:2-dehydropantoate 2-reductase